MAQFSLSPSIETREYDFTAGIPSVATSIGGYVGAFEWGPVKKIVNLSSEPQLKKYFGKPLDSNAADWFSASNFLGYSNYLKNIRVVDETTAKNACAAGTAALVKNYDDFEIKDSTLTANKFLAKYPGSLGDSLKVSIADKNVFLTWAYRSEYSTATKAVSTVKTYSLGSGITADVTANSDLLTNVTSVATFKVGMTITGTGIAAASKVAEILNMSTIKLDKIATTTGEGVALTGTLSTTITTFPGQPQTSAYVEEKGGADDEVHIIVIDEDGKFTGTKGEILEKFTGLSKATDAKTSDGSSNYYKDVINRNSAYIYCTDKIASDWDDDSTTEFTSLATSISYSLAGGVDTHSAITSADRIEGYAILRDPYTTDVQLVIGGVCDENIADYLVDNIAEYRKDCLVFISPPLAGLQGNTPEDSIIGFRNLLNNSTYAVMDTGWKYQYDSYNDKYRWVPLNADIAGLCANVDKVRDPWWSIAGFNRGYIKNVVKLAYNPIDKNARDNLYQLGINPVVTFSGEGTILYGDRTMTSKKTAFREIGIRRLFIMVEKAIATYAKYVQFEFNDTTTQTSFVNTVSPYLRDIKGRRGLTDYSVVADETVNTAEVVDSQGFIGNILLKPKHSINFIRLNYAAVATGMSFNEVEL